MRTDYRIYVTGASCAERHIAFREWAMRCDDPAFSQRRRTRHEAWLSQQTIPVLRLDGTRSVNDLATAVISALRR